MLIEYDLITLFSAAPASQTVNQVIEYVQPIAGCVNLKTT